MAKQKTPKKIKPEDVPEAGLSPEDFEKIEAQQKAATTIQAVEVQAEEQLAGALTTEETIQPIETALTQEEVLAEYKRLFEAIASLDDLDFFFHNVYQGQLQSLYEKNKIPLPRKEMDSYLKLLAKLGRGRAIDSLVEKCDYQKPEFQPEDQQKLAHWHETVKGINIICEWDTDYACYILYLPEIYGRESKDNLFAISESAEDAEKVFNIVKDLASKEEQEADTLESSYERAVSLYEQGFAAAKKYVVETPVTQKKLLERIHQQQNEKDFEDMLASVEASGWNAKDIEIQIQLAQDMRDSQHFDGFFSRRIEMVLKYLKTVKGIEEKRSEQLRKAVPNEKKRINEQYDSELEDLYKNLQEAFNQANEKEKSWLQEMVGKGVLQVLPEQTGRGWTFKLRPNAEKREELKTEALDFAIKKNNEKLYGITPAERELTGEEWHDFAETRRLMQFDKIKAEIQAAVQKIMDGKPGKVFGAIFKGRFAGVSELKPDRQAVGETVPNREFLRELFADRDFFRDLIFKTVADVVPETGEKIKVISDTEKNSYAGKIVVEELIDLFKLHFPEEADAIAANLLDSLYLEKLSDDDKRYKKQAEKSPRDIRGYTNFGNIHEDNLATTHFTQYLILQERYGLTTGYEQLDSFEAEDLDKVNTGLLVGSSSIGEGKSSFAQYLNIYKKHFGDKGARGKIIEALLPHAIADEEKREFILAGSEFTRELDHPAIIMRILKQEGYMTLQEVRAMLKEAAGDSRDEDGYGLQSDILKARRALFEVYSEEIEAILDKAV